ncbi:MAG: bifunctional 5,10-methylenetetrahydrofolate dehydrogenase/5,10-methenyltetrahydrofolate cyclohydrolase [Candidatus Niyogibacteria bacterium]|nr:MAG: bifunctional 5,10-methylenetetrahydrofolate dehydrogenase/5,10-methenyltetrahydrofolate cyclohydrolase [Candidatus Niyogibacteria bacterium]
MIIDGKNLAEEIKEELKKEISAAGKKLKLAVIYIGENPASASFIKRKQAYGAEIGIEVEIKKPKEEIWKSRAGLRDYLSKITHDKKNNGVIIQLPLPEEIKSRTQYLLDAIPADKDVDVLSSEAVGKFASARFSITPPVVGAIKHIFEKNKIELAGKNIVIVGEGVLVGKPVALWFLSRRLPFTILTTKSPNFSEVMAGADIVISGAGKSGLIKKGMVKNGVVAIDAGTSSESGQLKGDFDPVVSEKASLFTPVPGGIGPLTVAMLFKNFIVLSQKTKHRVSGKH